jgi:hypothetical protein
MNARRPRHSATIARGSGARTRPSCGPSSPRAGARAPRRRLAPPRPRSGSLAARPDPRGVPLAGARPRPLRLLLDRAPAPAQDDAGSAGACEVAARHRPSRRAATAARAGFGGRPDLAGRFAEVALAGRRRYRPHGSLRPPNERSVRISRTTLYREVAGQHRAANGRRAPR